MELVEDLQCRLGKYILDTSHNTGSVRQLTCKSPIGLTDFEKDVNSSWIRVLVWMILQ